jgi:hypothetical protein
MTLEELGKLITALKNNATHLGVKHTDVHITTNADDIEIYQINAGGTIEGREVFALIVKV